MILLYCSKPNVMELWHCNRVNVKLALYLHMYINLFVVYIGNAPGTLEGIIDKELKKEQMRMGKEESGKRCTGAFDGY